MGDFQPDFVAIVLAAIAGFVIGGLWYSPFLMGKVWMAETGLTDEQIASGNKGKIFGIAFVSLLIMSFCLEMFIGPTDTIGSGFYSRSQQGAFYGMLTGFGWMFFAFVVVGLFEHRSWKYILINGGYWIVTMTTMGGILGGWRWL